MLLWPLSRSANYFLPPLPLYLSRDESAVSLFFFFLPQDEQVRSLSETLTVTRKEMEELRRRGRDESDTLRNRLESTMMQLSTLRIEAEAAAKNAEINEDDLKRKLATATNEMCLLRTELTNVKSRLEQTDIELRRVQITLVLAFYFIFTHS